MTESKQEIISAKEFSKSIGKKIQKIRKKNKITQDNFARSINITRQYLSNLETGKAEIKLDIFIKICNELKIFPSSILDDYLKFYDKNAPSKRELLSKKNKVIVSNIITALLTQQQKEEEEEKTGRN